MQDKEFDQLFNSKLDVLEVEPSEQVWQNITGELDGKKAKRSIMPYLSIAASVIILASVSLLFYNRTKVKTEQPPVKLVKDIKPGKAQSVPATNETLMKDHVIEDDLRLHEAAVVKVAIKSGSWENRTKPEEQQKQEAVAIAESPVQKPEPVLAIVPAETKALPSTLPANDVIVSAGSLADRPVENIETPADAIMNTPETEKIPAKKRVRGLGGLINTVIAAVDKREDKLIEFTDAANDEGSRVTAVNLGIFKIKKQ